MQAKQVVFSKDKKKPCKYYDESLQPKMLIYFCFEKLTYLFENRIFYYLSYNLIMNYPCFKGFLVVFGYMYSIYMYVPFCDLFF